MTATGANPDRKDEFGSVAGAARLLARVFLRAAGLAPSAEPTPLPATDTESLVAVAAAMARRGKLSYLELNASSTQTAGRLLSDADCDQAILVSGRQTDSPVVMSEANDRVSRIRSSVTDVTPASLSASLCLIRSMGDTASTLRDARFCLAVLRGRGVIVFQNRTLVSAGIVRFLSQVEACHAYPLTTELFVVEVGIPTLVTDAAVATRLPRQRWARVSRDRRRVIGALALTGVLRALGAALGAALLLGGARRPGRADSPERASEGTKQPPFTVHTFVNDDLQYGEMCAAFTRAGFDPQHFVPLSDTQDDPYQAITRLGRSPDAQYPILCHQDVRPDRGVGAAELWRRLTELDESDPSWVVAGPAGVTATGEIIRRFVNPLGPPESAPAAVRASSLDECLLIFNARNTARCSPALHGFHLYGTDVCLHAERSGGSAYVLNFPITHLSEGNVDASYRAAEARLREQWRRAYRFRYVVSTVGTIFLSRSPTLSRVFSSRLVMACVRLCVQSQR